MVALVVAGVLLFGLAGLLLGVSLGLGSKPEVDREKGSPFECGFDPLGSGRIGFSLRFFMIAIIFLIFDIEIALLLPLCVAQEGVGSLLWSFESSVFLSILFLGTIYEWANGALDWKSLDCSL